MAQFLGFSANCLKGIDLAAALAALLFQHAPGQEQGLYECFPQSGAEKVMELRALWSGYEPRTFEANICLRVHLPRNYFRR